MGSFNPKTGPKIPKNSEDLSAGFQGCASKCSLYNVIVWNSSGTDLYLLVFNAAQATSNGAVSTLPPQKIAGDATGYFDYDGRPMSNGVYVALSTTAPALNLATAVGWFDVCVS